MKVVTLRGTYEIDLSAMKIVRVGAIEIDIPLKKVPSPVVGERMELETEDGTATTEQVVTVEA